LPCFLATACIFDTDILPFSVGFAISLIRLLQYRVFGSLCPQARQASDDVPADEGFLCDEAAALGDTIKEALSFKYVTVYQTSVNKHPQFT